MTWNIISTHIWCIRDIARGSTLTQLRFRLISWWIESKGCDISQRKCYYFHKDYFTRTIFYFQKDEPKDITYQLPHDYDFQVLIFMVAFNGYMNTEVIAFWMYFLNTKRIYALIFQ